MDPRSMRDPSEGIHRDLQPHVHLVSTYRYPNLLSLHPDKVAEWLLAAPKIASNEAPFYWTYLDRPTPATILLTWQTPSIGTDFPSDGYVWAPGETSFQLEVEGGTLELYHAKTGYGPGEPLATHSRRRYRLVPSSRVPQRQGAPQPNPSLWIVHYGQAEPSDRVPSTLIPVDMRIQNSINTRTYLQSQGQIVQKEFMLQDRASWPQIAFPRNQPRGTPMYGGHAPPTRVPQAMAYPPQHATAGPPAKRVRTQANVNQAVAGGVVSAVLDIDDEEDTSRGDLFDHTTPREISVSRYKQNHEWMEEVLSSPYSMGQLIPADLGLGFRGKLATLTEGIFDAPLDPDHDAIKNEYVGRLDPNKADEFRKRVQDHVEQSNKEIEKMKAKHAKRLAKFQHGSVISRAEKELRNAVHEPTDIGPEYWRLEGRVDAEENDEEEVVATVTPSKVSDILEKVEAALDRRAAVVQDLVRIQDGGYEVPAAFPTPLPPPVPSPRVSPPVSNNGSQNSGVLVGDADIEMGGSAAGLLDQFHAGLSSNATPGSGFPTPQPYLQPHSAIGTPSNIPTTSPQPSGNTPLQQTTQNDTNMTDAGSSNEHTVPDTSGTGGDWVVVPPGGVSGGISPSGASAQTSQPAVEPSQSTTPAILPPTTTSAPITANPSPLPTASTSQTPAADFHTSPNDFADLGDLDSAGDALASYGEDLGGNGHDLGDLAMDMDGGMEDSAFGEAFHGVEPRTEGENEGNGM